MEGERQNRVEEVNHHCKVLFHSYNLIKGQAAEHFENVVAHGPVWHVAALLAVCDLEKCRGNCVEVLNIFGKSGGVLFYLINGVVNLSELLELVLKKVGATILNLEPVEHVYLGVAQDLVLDQEA